jgi:capsid protein
VFVKTNTTEPPQRTWLDRAITWASPERGVRRAAWRQMEASYKGGIPTRTSEPFDQPQGFRFGTSSDRLQVTDARGRAYQAYDNNPVAKALVQTERDHVIGDGLNYQPTTDSTDWNREAEDRYYDWLENCSVRGSDAEHGGKLQGDLWARSRVAGDIGWILVGRGVESRIQVVSPENIVTPDTMWGDATVYDGIRFDEFGQPQVFYVLQQDERNGTRKFIPVGARDFVWLPHMTKPNQARPPSCFITVFDLLAHLDRYVDGVSLAAWMATVFGIVFKQKNSAKQLASLGTLTNSQGDQQKAITFENGAVKYIGTDDEVAQVQARQPMQQTPEFIRAMLRMLGQPFDMPLEVIAKDMSTCNFASARIGLLPFYRSCRIKAARFGAHWSRTIRWWLSRERQRLPPNYWKHD